MKILLVSDSLHSRSYLERELAVQVADVIQYDNPIKAMDNLDEIRPQLVLFSATDYPRHWKPFTRYLRTTFARRETVLALLAPDSFSVDDVAAAEHLDVNAILSNDLSERRTLERIRAIATHYHQARDLRRSARLMPDPQDRVRFAATNPYTVELITGRVLDISSGGLRVAPEGTIASLDADAAAMTSVLRIGASIYPMTVRVIRNEETLAVEYESLSIDADHAIRTFIEERATAGSGVDGPRLGQ